MSVQAASVLVVDDSSVNRQLLQRILVAEGYVPSLAANADEALGAIRLAIPDVVLLDIVMPGMDGFELLEILKGDETVRHVPVIMISSIEEIESVVRCIESGATDYLPKPFNPAILRARLASSLAEKRLRDVEREYLRQVEVLTSAASSLEAGSFEPSILDSVSSRGDALGGLSRVFQRMAIEVVAREERLVRQVRELRIEIDDARRDREVSRITGSDYFRSLRDSASELRRSIQSPRGDDA